MNPASLPHLAYTHWSTSRKIMNLKDLVEPPSTGMVAVMEPQAPTPLEMILSILWKNGTPGCK